MHTAIKCDFETDFCGFEVSGTAEHFNFTIQQAGHIDSSSGGPEHDHLGSQDGHFAFVSSDGQNDEGSQTEMETYMIHGANHLLECLSFWATIKVLQH